jgi:phenylacetaldehyde dehydrogenase
MTIAAPSGLLPSVESFTSGPKQLLIDGKWVPSASGKTFATVDPATGQEICSVAHGEAEDVRRAVAAARKAFDDSAWTSMPPHERQKLLWRIGDMIDARAAEFAQLETIDNGMSTVFAEGVLVAWAAEIFRYYAGLCTKIEGRTITPSQPWLPGVEWHAYTMHEPIGVCGAIAPWNVPVLAAASKLGPALATGNTLVLKPAEQTPLTALLLGELMMEAGLPPGVVNIVTGFGDAGAAIAAHDDVDKVAFTGSTEVGKLLVKAAAGNLKKLTLELGGKSPNIIFADADMDKAVVGSANAWLFNAGQACTAGSRMFVEDKIFDEFTAGVAEVAKSVKVGSGFDPEAQLGPLISQEQFDRVTGYISQGKDDGARAITGGNRIGDTGFFVEPTVLVDVHDDMSVMREEIFGPVVGAVPFSAEDLGQVADAANRTTYGLASGIWTRDVSRAHKLAKKIKAGTVWINTYNAFDVAVPFGGYKQSGWGREMGIEAIGAYTQTKAVNIEL